MTEHMSMNTIIHAAVRRDLNRFDLAFGSFGAGSQRRADELAGAWKNLSFQLHHHHEDEESIFWPAFRSLGVDDSLIGELKGEHEQMLVALDTADKTVDAFHADPTASKAGAAQAAVGELERVFSEHLAHEERDLEPRFAEFHASPEIKSALRQVRRAHRGNQGTLFAWLMDGADADSKRGLRQEVPPPVLLVISRFGGRRYQRTIAPVWA